MSVWLTSGAEELLAIAKEAGEKIEVRPLGRIMSCEEKGCARFSLDLIGNDKSAYRQRPPNEESGFLEEYDLTVAFAQNRGRKLE